jgi:hypothetical protein
MQSYTVYLKTALHVSGGTITRHQERKQQHRVLFKNLSDGHSVKKLKASVKFQDSLSSQEPATKF